MPAASTASAALGSNNRGTKRAAPEQPATADDAAAAAAGAASASKRARKASPSSSACSSGGDGFISKFVVTPAITVWTGFTSLFRGGRAGAAAAAMDDVQVISHKRGKDDLNVPEHRRATGAAGFFGVDSGDSDCCEIIPGGADDAVVRTRASEPSIINDTCRYDEVELVVVPNASASSEKIPTFVDMTRGGDGGGRGRGGGGTGGTGGLGRDELFSIPRQPRAFIASGGRRGIGASSPARFHVATKEKRAKDRLDAAPGAILKQVRQKQNLSGAGPQQLFGGMTPRSDLLGVKNPGLKTPRQESPSRQRRFGYGISESYRMDEKARYQAILACVAPWANSTIAHRGYTAGRAPTPALFNRAGQPPTSARTPAANAAIVKQFPSREESFSLRRRIEESSRRRSAAARETPESAPRRPPPARPTAPLVDLASDDEPVILAAATNRSTTKAAAAGKDADIIEIIREFVPAAAAVDDETPPSPSEASSETSNSLKLEFARQACVSPEWIASLRSKYDVRFRERGRDIAEAKVCLEAAAEKNRKTEEEVQERIRRHLSITDVAVEEEVEEEEEELPEITAEMDAVIKRAENARSSETLVEAFRIPIARKDIDTLKGLNWLNDEVINFYMQMIAARSEQKNSKLPKVFAFNTFFYPKIVGSGPGQGFASVKRWTKKVDLFSFDLVFVPVHLGMHWCLSVIDLRKERLGVYYYDSMGGDNRHVLPALLRYLQDEHEDKKKAAYDTSAFKQELKKEIPQQMNGSDCGMFTCKFAEYISRDAEITFTQQDMPYFRRRMIYEIVENNIMNP